MTRIIDQVKPEQFISYGNLKVAFYDAKNPGYEKIKARGGNASKYLTYVHILLADDTRSIIQREVKNIRVPDGQGGTKEVSEKEAFKRAYDLYLNLKQSSIINESVEIERLKAEIEELRKQNSNKGVARKPVSESSVEKTLSEK